jgi:drug/metabolite transporter (DMT)-like permease
VIAGLLAALGASVGYAVATILQAVGSRRASGLRALYQPLVAAGLALDGASFLLSLVAYVRLPLFGVQTIIAASVAGVVLLAVPFLKVPLRRVDVAGVVAVVAGLAVVATVSGDQPATRAPDGFVLATLVCAGALAVLLAVLYRRGPAWSLGTASALGYAGVAVAARGATTGGDWWQLVLQPLAPAILVFGVVAFVAYVRALERGPVGLAAGLVAVIEVVVPGLAGLALFGDSVPAGLAVPAAVAVAVALAGCVVLSRSPANGVAGGEVR